MDWPMQAAQRHLRRMIERARAELKTAAKRTGNATCHHTLC